MLAVLLILLGAALRVAPHEANFAPIAAIALFGGVYLNRRYALVLPLIALLLSDLVLGFDSIQSRLTVYSAFLLIGVIGLLVRKRKNIFTIVGGTAGGSILFYLITNFAYFYPGTMYPHNLAGIFSSYYNALPFFRNTLAGDLFYVGLLVGSYELALLIGKRVHKVSATTV